MSYNDTQDLKWKDFYNAIADQRFDGPAEPYRFGSYQIYKADSDKQQYQVNMFVNATSESSVPFYSQYIYEAILKNVNSDIKFKTKTVPFPVFYFFESRAAVG